MRSTILLLLLVAGATSLPAQLQYDRTLYPSPDARGATSADFDRDGLPDLAIGARNGVNLFRNIGNGNFSGPVFHAVPSLNALHAVDVNGDRWPDIVINNDDATANNYLPVLLNNGNGTFRAGPVTQTDKKPQGRFGGDFSSGLAIAAGDLNGDGKIDLAVIEEGIQIEILKGNGTGAFTSSQILQLSGRTWKVEIEDLNGDGNLDIVNTVPTKTLVWWGNGNATFRAPLMLLNPDPQSDPLFSFAIGDFNNDGIADLASASSDGCEYPDRCGTNTVFVYRNNGAGTFTRVSSFDIGGVPSGNIYSTDLNGDQNADIAYAQGDIWAGDFSYALGNGNGTFGAAVFVIELGNEELLFRDLNLDSRKDWVNPNIFSDGMNVSLSLNAFTNCAPPGSASIAAKICGPANGATVASPVLVRGSGNSPVGVKRLEVWIDGKKVFQRLGDQVAKRFTLAPGNHRIAIVAVDKHLGTSTTARNITVP